MGGNPDVKTEMDINARDGSTVTLGHVTLEPAAHLYIMADGGHVKMAELTDKTHGKGVKYNVMNHGSITVPKVTLLI